MVALEKQLEASQRFLGGVRSLPSYEDIEQKQLRGLLIAVGKSKDLSTSQSASFLQAIDPRLWSEAAVEELQRLVARKTSQDLASRGRWRAQENARLQSDHTLSVARCVDIDLGGQSNVRSSFASVVPACGPDVTTGAFRTHHCRLCDIGELAANS